MDGKYLNFKLNPYNLLNKTIKKRIIVGNIIKLKCPRCHRGNLFINPGLFVLTEILKMPDHCPECQQDFKIEPGFYTAALWISYPIVLTVFVPLVFFGIMMNEHYLISYLIIIPLLTLVCLILQIPIMRLSRAILINLTIGFKEK